ncbi:MAG: poly(ethylene terephthalate) hydrolase family protein, partial [Polyangiales bacterium]
MRAAFAGLMIAGVFSSSVASAADYAAKGSVATTTTTLAMGFAGSSGGKLVVPNATGTYPLIVASHGFSASADNQVGWAEQFASYGFVVVVPTFPGSFSPDHVKNGKIIKDIVASIATADTPAKGKVDTTHVGLEGHSAGGLATTLAAADLSPAATVLFDPVDASDLGKAAYAKLCSPVIDLFAMPSSCNNTAGWFAFRTTSKGPTTSFRVKGSTHCDGENAARSLCGLTCGGAADPTRQNVYARYATAFFLAHLKGDSAAAAQLTLGTLSGDGEIGEVSIGGAGCTTGGDAGTDSGPATDSGSARDSATTSDSATAPDTGAATDSGSTESDTGDSIDDAAPGTSSDTGASAAGGGSTAD